MLPQAISNLQNETKAAANVENNVSMVYNKSNLRDDPLFIQMMQRVDSDYVGELVVNDYYNYYIITKNLNNEYEINKTIPITDNNVDYIKEIEKEFNDDKGRKRFNSNIKTTEPGQNNSNSNNVNVEGEETWIQFIDRLLEKNKSETFNNSNNIERSNENFRELDNSSFLNEKQYEELQEEKKSLESRLKRSQENYS